MITFRPADVNDADRIGHLHVMGWRGAYGGLIDQAYLDGLSAGTRAGRWREWLAEGSCDVILAEEDGEAVGFVSYGSLRTPPPGQSKIMPAYSAEILALYILPDHYRKGIGRALLDQAARALWGRKHGGVALWVLEGNKRACAFYAALGGQRIGKEMKQVGPDKAMEVCYGWRNVRRLFLPGEI